MEFFYNFPNLSFMGISKQEYSSGLSFPSPVGHVLPELSNMTCPSSVALHSMVHKKQQLELDMGQQTGSK